MSLFLPFFGFDGAPNFPRMEEIDEEKKQKAEILAIKEFIIEHGSLEGRLRGKKVRSRNSGVVR